MKTVTLEHGSLFGQPKGWFLTLVYRGTILKEYQFTLHEEFTVRAQALEWAKNQGFTHYQKTGEWCKRVIKKAPI